MCWCCLIKVKISLCLSKLQLAKVGAFLSLRRRVYSSVLPGLPCLVLLRCQWRYTHLHTFTFILQIPLAVQGWSTPIFQLCATSFAWVKNFVTVMNYHRHHLSSFITLLCFVACRHRAHSPAVITRSKSISQTRGWIAAIIRGNAGMLQHTGIPRDGNRHLGSTYVNSLRSSVPSFTISWVVIAQRLVHTTSTACS